ncbi:MAG: hypothetical protein PHP45_04750 [Elusimicrobiales bacterium]|nr:hypothetical protein [Elusimicrobiales bacterium]
MAGNKNNIVVGLQAENTLKIGDYGTLEAAALDIGFIKGGVQIQHSVDWYDVEVDQVLGIVDKVPKKEGIALKFSMAEATLANLQAALGHSGVSVASNTLKMTDGPSANYKTLFVNVKGPSGGTRKYTFWRVVFTGKVSPAYKRDNETLFDVEADVLCDTTKDASVRFGQIDDAAQG